MTSIRLDKRFKKNVAGRVGRYDFVVGVLEDGPHKEPKTGKRGQGGKDVLGTYAGGPVRKKSSRTGPLTIAEVSEANRARMEVNYLTDPFQKKTSDIIRFTASFMKMIFGGKKSVVSSAKRRTENLLQAVVRNPILRGDYGSNTPLTKRIKGFDRKMIDTAQLFKAIKAKCRLRPRV